MEDNTTEQFDIVPTHLAVQAMRDNGYKNAAYAIAELMDNAIQAGATHVELLCGEKTSVVEQRSRTRVEQIAVLDNGCGMDADVLRMAMQFGNGTRLDAGQQTGIGRFGMGLPASSVSQCTRVDVWTWQDGPENALHTYLDLDQIKQRLQSSVPRPTARAIPEVWRKVGSEWGQSGTLVVWSNLDKCTWRTSTAIIDNSEFLIGRMYRRFLDSGRVGIKLTWFNLDNPRVPFSKAAEPNDPGYLMAKTSCPAPFHNTPMFLPWGEEDNELLFTVPYAGQSHLVRVIFSIAKPEARRDESGREAGARPWGKHAKGNIGVSMVRAGRELEMDQGMVSGYDPRERWWGVEIEFPPALDDMFGVTNNKQSARNFADIAKVDIDNLLKGGRTLHELKEEFAENEDPRGALLEIVHAIGKNLSKLRADIKDQAVGGRNLPSDVLDIAGPEAEAAARTKQRQEEGHVGKSDRDESLPSDVRREHIEQSLKDFGLPDAVASTQAAHMVSTNVKYQFVHGEVDSGAFFSVRTRGSGSIIIGLNTRHPAYDKLIEVLEESVSGASPDELRSRLNNARDGLKTLLIAWARYEDEQPEGVQSERAQKARVDWGCVARTFLSSNE